MAKINDLPLLPNPTEDMYCLVGKDDLKKVPWSAIMGQIGAPYIATTVAGMTDKTRVYVYQGSESGYTSGNWYYWNGSAWTSGGIYNSAAVDTDKTLTQSDKPADSAFDKAYFVLTIDDANKYLPDVYDLCHELGVPLCPAIIVGNLNTDYKNDGRTIKDICDLVVADGGEILAHSGKYITKENTEEDYADVFRMPKIELEKLGYDIRGIITAGGAGYLSNDIKLDNWSRKYFDYSDQNGVSSSKAYYHPRWWFHDYTMDGAKSYVDTAITNKSFVVVAMHGSDRTDDLEHIDHVRELLQYIISKGSDKIEITTWAKVYDKFKSTKLEERIKVLESS